MNMFFSFKFLQFTPDVPFNARHVNISWKVSTAPPSRDFFQLFQVLLPPPSKGFMNALIFFPAEVAVTVSLQFELLPSRKSDTNVLALYGNKLGQMHVGHIIMP